MNKIFLFATILLSTNAIAQQGIVLTKGQKIISTSTISSETDMSMGMQMKNASVVTNQIQVFSADKNKYGLVNTITKMTASFDMMGQESSYDSEKPGDKDSDLGKELSKKVNIPDSVFIDKATGELVDKAEKKSPERPDKKEPNMNAMMDMLGGMNPDGGTNLFLQQSFFIIPKGKKAGDSWSDSSTEGGMKNLRTYTIKSIDKDVATIEVKALMTGTTDMDMQGTSVAIKLDTKSLTEMKVNVKTSLVSNSNTTAEINGNMDLMGQSMPISSKVSNSVKFEFQ